MIEKICGTIEDCHEKLFFRQCISFVIPVGAHDDEIMTTFFDGYFAWTSPESAGCFSCMENYIYTFYRLLQRIST